MPKSSKKMSCVGTKDFSSILDWIETQQEHMLARVRAWSQINTHTFHQHGLQDLCRTMAPFFSCFEENIQFIDLPNMQDIDGRGQKRLRPLGQVIRLRKRPDALRQVLLLCHMDTVYPPDDTVSSSILQEGSGILRGPGVTDAKGGIVVLLTALQALERSPACSSLGWEVVINPDEEIGSPGSGTILQEAAARNQLGLIFEPCFPNGDLVGNRKGSGNFTFVFHGHSAHAGRDHHLGRSAIKAMAHAVIALDQLAGSRPGVTVNVGMVEGGKALNVIPDGALARVNVRFQQREDEEYLYAELRKIQQSVAANDNVEVELSGGFFAPPKLIQGVTRNIYDAVQRCGNDLGLDLHFQDSGGVCDGNRLQAWGLPNVDTLGPRGGDIHSDKEYLVIDSLTERAKLSALFLMRLSAGEIPAFG
jgi:glutamate carboxypeptidase